MKDTNVCTCKDAARLESTIVLFCGRCGGRVLNVDDAQRVYELNQNVIDGSPASLSDGNFRIATGNASPDFEPSKTGMTRRKFFDTLLTAGIATLATLLSEPIRVLIGIETGAIEDEEASRMQIRGQILTNEDIDAVEFALTNISDLQALAAQYRVENRHAVAKLLEALSIHVFGISPKSSTKTLTELLAIDHPQSVKRYLYLRRAKARALIGESEQGLDDLEKAIELTTENEKQFRVKLLRQAMNHAYISIQPNDTPNSVYWHRLQQFQKRALEDMELKADLDLPDLTQRAMNFDPMIGSGVLIFEAITRALERKDSKDECRRILHWHLDLISSFQQYDPINGWNQYSRLASQAIALGHLDIAETVLTRARQYAFSDSNDRVSQFAKKQRLNQGVEWLLHEVVLAALHIAKHKSSIHPRDRAGEIEMARTALVEPLKIENAIKGHTFLRAAKLYELETIPKENKQQRVDVFVEAFNTPARNYWVYFPNLPQRENLG